MSLNGSCQLRICLSVVFRDATIVDVRDASTLQILKRIGSDLLPGVPKTFGSRKRNTIGF